MPETGFSLRRIIAHLRKWIGLYLAGMIAVCFLNHLVFTVTRPSFSDDERLKIMLLNIENRLSEEDFAGLSMDLLPKIQQADSGIQILEFEQLPWTAAGDAASEMLLSVKLTGGFGDIFITDDAGYALLRSKGACAHAEYLESCVLTDGGAWMIVAANTTDMPSAMAALEILRSAL